MMAEKNRWYILEDLDKSIDYGGHNILALTPRVCYELDKRGVKYSILEDFYNEAELTKSADKYFFSVYIKGFRTIRRISVCCYFTDPKSRFY